MRKWILLAACALVAQACFTVILEEETSATEDLPDYLKPSGDIIVVTGLAYPEGVDWTVSGLDNPGARLVMYMDKELKVNLSTDASEGVACTDPYLHFFSGGQLYSAFLSDESSTLARNGVKMLQLEGRKYLLAVREDSITVRTLWENEGGRGFVSLDGGEKVFENQEGSIYKNIGENELGELCFFYSVPVKSSSGMLTQYHCVCGKENIQMDLPRELVNIFGFIRSPDGFKVLCRNEGNRMNYEMYDTSTGSSMLLFPPWDGQLTALSNDTPALFHACLTRPTGKVWNVIQIDGLHAVEWDGDDYALGFIRTGDGTAGILKSRTGEDRDLLIRGKLCDSLPSGYTVLTDKAVNISYDGYARIGLSSKTGGRALLWSEGKIDTLGFRGVVTGVYTLEREEEPAQESIRTTWPTDGRDHIFTPR